MKPDFNLLFEVKNVLTLLAALFLLSACAGTKPVTVPGGTETAHERIGQLIPLPVSVTPGTGVFRLTAETQIVTPAGSPELERLGRYLADIVRPATGFQLAVQAASGGAGENRIELAIGSNRPELGAEGYALDVTPARVTLTANQPEGVFRGLQTLRQLFPPALGSATVQQAEWTAPAVRIVDHPRYAWRGVMQDVARHFFSVADIKRYIDHLSYYKINRLHLHLSDDQGWRIQIDSWPNLTQHGGQTAVGGGKGGFYTKADYAEIVRYAADRFITIIPEIDLPGHTNAALSSYAELNCDGQAPAMRTDIEVGYSTVCVDSETTYRFVDDIVREISAMTPGPYFHIGGDEVQELTTEQYTRFIERTQDIVLKHGKKVIGWDEIAHTTLRPETLVQHWAFDSLGIAAIEKGARLIMSPADRAYMDMKYDSTTALGLHWAGYTDVVDAYTWDPAEKLKGVAEDRIVGVEAPMWAETLVTLEDIEYMAFPRLPGYAEIGWSPAGPRSWDTYRVRLAAHGPRLEAMGVNYFRAPQVPWK